MVDHVFITHVTWRGFECEVNQGQLHVVSRGNGRLVHSSIRIRAHSVFGIIFDEYRVQHQVDIKYQYADIYDIDIDFEHWYRLRNIDHGNARNIVPPLTLISISTRTDTLRWSGRCSAAAADRVPWWYRRSSWCSSCWGCRSGPASSCCRSWTSSGSTGRCRQQEGWELADLLDTPEQKTHYKLDGRIRRSIIQRPFFFLCFRSDIFPLREAVSLYSVCLHLNKQRCLSLKAKL